MEDPLAAAVLMLGLIVAGCNGGVENQAANSLHPMQAAHPVNDELEPRCDDWRPSDRAHCRQWLAAARPSASVVERLESRLAGHPCVGDLRRWQRVYSFASVRDNLTLGDQSRLAFIFRQAGVQGFVTGRRITAPEIWVQIDDRRYNFVRGYYDLNRGSLTVDYCGSN